MKGCVHGSVARRWLERGRLPDHVESCMNIRAVSSRCVGQKLEEFASSAKAQGKIANAHYACGFTAPRACDDLFSADGVQFAMNAL